MSHSIKETTPTQEPLSRYKLESRHSSCSCHAGVVAGTQKNDTFSISDNSLNVKSKLSAAGPEAGGDSSSVDNTATTNSNSDRLEMKIIKANFSESEIEGDLVADSNFQLIKTNIQSILQKFFTNVQDLELYKSKFNDLIAKRHTRDEMDAFVNEVMAHLKETESRQTLGHKTYSCSCRGDCFCAQYPSDTNEAHSRQNENKHVNIISFKNMNFKSDTSEGGSNKADLEFIKDQRTFKTMEHAKDLSPKTLSSNLSEMILRASFDIDIIEAASAENIPKLEAKRIELENMNAGDDSDKSEKDIPIKVSHPKRNIHTNEDFSCRRNDESDSFLSKLCGFLCKRFRRHC